MTKETQLYEIGFLINPELSEDQAGAELGTARSIIEKHSGILESTTDPKLRKLSYPIKKISQAYFAALQFSISSASILQIKEDINSNNNILRFLILSWTRTPARPVLHRPKRTGTATDTTINRQKPPKQNVDTEEVAEKIDEKELDKKLDEILGQ